MDGTSGSRENPFRVAPRRALRLLQLELRLAPAIPKPHTAPVGMLLAWRWRAVHLRGLGAVRARMCSYCGLVNVVNRFPRPLFAARWRWSESGNCAIRAWRLAYEARPRRRLLGGWIDDALPAVGGLGGVALSAYGRKVSSTCSRRPPGRGRDGGSRRAFWTCGHRAWLPRAFGPHRGRNGVLTSGACSSAWRAEVAAGGMAGAGGMHLRSDDLSLIVNPPVPTAFG